MLASESSDSSSSEAPASESSPTLSLMASTEHISVSQTRLVKVLTIVIENLVHLILDILFD